MELLEAGRRKGLDPFVEAGADTPQRMQGEIVGVQPVGVTREWPSEAEEPHCDDRRGQRENRRPFGCARDEVSRGGHQGDSEDDRERSERDGDAVRETRIPDSASRRRRVFTRRPPRRTRRGFQLEPYDAVAACGELFAMCDEQERAPAQEAIDRVADDLGALGIEVRRRLVEDQQGAFRRNARANPIRRIWPGESGRPPSPTTVS